MIAPEDMLTDANGRDLDALGTPVPELPAYLTETYTWAYLNPRTVPWLDNNLVVSVILWGNTWRLIGAAREELEPGWRVLQPAAVYGSLSKHLIERLGPAGHLEVSDVAPIQVARAAEKLKAYPNATVRRADAEATDRSPYDAVTCFFLLHEVPEEVKSRIVSHLLGLIEPHGKVIFVDYHRPAWWHPLRPLMSVILDRLEPFAKGLYGREIMDYAENAEAYTWRKRTYFGGLYQKVVAKRRGTGHSASSP